MTTADRLGVGGTSTSTMTVVQTIQQAQEMIDRQIKNDPSSPGHREFEIAAQRLEEARMWFTTGWARATGDYNVADLQQQGMAPS